MYLSPKRLFEKYQIALANPRKSPLAPLKKGGSDSYSPFLRGLGGLIYTFQTPSKTIVAATQELKQQNS